MDDGECNDTSNRSHDTSLSSTHVAAYDYVRLNEALLTNKVMLFAYAASIIIVALGCVGLVIAVVILCFFYPDKADAFIKMLVLAAPLVGILIANISKIKSATKKIANGQSSPNQ